MITFEVDSEDSRHGHVAILVPIPSGSASRPLRYSDLDFET